MESADTRQQNPVKWSARLLRNYYHNTTVSHEHEKHVKRHVKRHARKTGPLTYQGEGRGGNPATTTVDIIVSLLVRRRIPAGCLPNALSPTRYIVCWGIICVRSTGVYTTIISALYNNHIRKLNNWYYCCHDCEYQEVNPAGCPSIILRYI